jgi:hypothetical protein
MAVYIYVGFFQLFNIFFVVFLKASSMQSISQDALACTLTSNIGDSFPLGEDI